MKIISIFTINNNDENFHNLLITQYPPASFFLEPN